MKLLVVASLLASIVGTLSVAGKVAVVGVFSPALLHLPNGIVVIGQLVKFDPVQLFLVTAVQEHKPRRALSHGFKIIFSSVVLCSHRECRIQTIRLGPVGKAHEEAAGSHTRAASNTSRVSTALPTSHVAHSSSRTEVQQTSTKPKDGPSAASAGTEKSSKQPTTQTNRSTGHSDRQLNPPQTARNTTPSAASAGTEKSSKQPTTQTNRSTGHSDRQLNPPQTARNTTKQHRMVVFRCDQSTNAYVRPCWILTAFVTFASALLFAILVVTIIFLARKCKEKRFKEANRQVFFRNSDSSLADNSIFQPGNKVVLHPQPSRTDQPRTENKETLNGRYISIKFPFRGKLRPGKPINPSESHTDYATLQPRERPSDGLPTVKSPGPSAGIDHDQASALYDASMPADLPHPMQVSNSENLPLCTFTDFQQ